MDCVVSVASREIIGEPDPISCLVGQLIWSSSGETKGLLTATDLGVEEAASEAGLEGELMSA